MAGNKSKAKLGLSKLQEDCPYTLFQANVNLANRFEKVDKCQAGCLGTSNYDVRKIYFDEPDIVEHRGELVLRHKIGIRRIDYVNLVGKQSIMETEAANSRVSNKNLIIHLLRIRNH